MTVTETPPRELSHPIAKGWLVHGVTAFGAVFGMLGIIAVSDHQPREAVLWLALKVKAAGSKEPEVQLVLVPRPREMSLVSFPPTVRKLVRSELLKVAVPRMWPAPPQAKITQPGVAGVIVGGLGMAEFAPDAEAAVTSMGVVGLAFRHTEMQTAPAAAVLLVVGRVMVVSGEPPMNLYATRRASSPSEWPLVS